MQIYKDIKIMKYQRYILVKLLYMPPKKLKELARSLMTGIVKYYKHKKNTNK